MRSNDLKTSNKSFHRIGEERRLLPSELVAGSYESRMNMKDVQTKTSFVISNYSTLEQQLVDFLSFLPYTDDNQGVISPRLIPIILDACSLIDSILRDFINKPGQRSSFKRYASEVDECLELNDTFTLFLNTKLAFLNPFASWGTKVPSWWVAYNALKHDRLNNSSAATFENTVLSLCALHQVIARNRSFIPSLIYAGWFDYGGEDLHEIICAQLSMPGAVPIRVVPVETRLFVTPLHSNFVDFPDGRPVIDEHCHFSPRVNAMISAFEWL